MSYWQSLGQKHVWCIRFLTRLASDSIQMFLNLGQRMPGSNWPTQILSRYPQYL